MKSGISDYSEVLVYGLRNHFDITLLIDDYELENPRLYADFEVSVYSKDHTIFNLFDYHIYNMGNNPYYHKYIYDAALRKPGLIIMHDAVLYFLTLGFYGDRRILYSKVYELAEATGIQLVKPHVRGGQDLLAIKQLAAILPLNQELLRSRNKIMVHSDYAFGQVKAHVDDPARLRRINMLAQIPDDAQFLPKGELFEKYHIPDDMTTVSSFGSIDRTKLNHTICETVKDLNRRRKDKVLYLMVGEGDYVDDYLGPFIRKTGRVPLSDFNSFIQHTDIVVNLRHPSMGETSAVLIRAMGLGKPSIVSDDAWFSELPDDVALKISNEHAQRDLAGALSDLIKNTDKRIRLSQNASEYVAREHGAKTIAANIAEFLEDLPLSSQCLSPAENTSESMAAPVRLWEVLKAETEMKYALRKSRQQVHTW